MNKIIIAVYKKDERDYKPLVGVFQETLEGEPLFKEQLTLHRKESQVEESVATNVNALLKGRLLNQNYTIDFFDGIRVVKTDKKNVTFIKPGLYFSYDILLMKLELE